MGLGHILPLLLQQLKVIFFDYGRRYRCKTFGREWNKSILRLKWKVPMFGNGNMNGVKFLLLIPVGTYASGSSQRINQSRTSFYRARSSFTDSSTDWLTKSSARHKNVGDITLSQYTLISPPLSGYSLSALRTFFYEVSLTSETMRYLDRRESCRAAEKERYLQIFFF